MEENLTLLLYGDSLKTPFSILELDQNLYNGWIIVQYVTPYVLCVLNIIAREIL